jgi:hypothetical protein
MDVLSINNPDIAALLPHGPNGHLRQLLLGLALGGVVLRVDRGSLVLSGTGLDADPELIAGVKRRKQELLALHELVNRTWKVQV